MKLKNLYALLMLICFACSSEKKEVPTFTLKTLKSGIDIEIFAEDVDDKNKYNYDNKILIPKSTFEYNLQIISKEGDSLYFKRVNNKEKNNWEFTDKNDPDVITVSRITVDEGNAMGDWNPGYYQTNLKYYLGKEKKYSMSGGIDNKKNVWIHPHRDLYLKILELNPFPYIKAPYKIGTKWKWALQIGNSWQDKRWATWEGGIIARYNYEIVREEKIETPLGSLNCYVIIGEGNSELGQTRLESYFHKKHGFVKLNYKNIDGSHTILTLQKHTEL